MVKLHAYLSVSYGFLVFNLSYPTDPHNAACAKGDLTRVYRDAQALSDFARQLAEGGAQ